MPKPKWDRNEDLYAARLRGKTFVELGKRYKMKPQTARAIFKRVEASKKKRAAQRSSLNSSRAKGVSR